MPDTVIPEAGAAADLVVRRFADSPDILGFCSRFDSIGNGNPTWAGRYEKHLRTILEKNPHRRVRTASQIKGISYRVEAQLPPDMLGIYVYLPKV